MEEWQIYELAVGRCISALEKLLATDNPIAGYVGKVFYDEAIDDALDEMRRVATMDIYE